MGSNRYVRSCTTGNATFIIARRLRYGPSYGNTAGPNGGCAPGTVCIPGDNLSGGASVQFYSGNAATGHPVLRLEVGGAPPPPPATSSYLTFNPPAPAPT